MSKSFALLMEPLRHINNPKFGAVIFRRTYPEIKNEGGLWDEASNIYPLVGARPRETALEWEFTSGAKVKFAHMQLEKDKYSWQGSQVPLICCEEDTPIVMGDGSSKPLCDIQVGDMVMTLEGARSVRWKGPRREENCVKATVYDAKRHVVGRQVQSDTHKVLTAQGWFSYADIVGVSHPSLSSSPRESRISCKSESPLEQKCYTHALSHGIRNGRQGHISEQSQLPLDRQGMLDFCVDGALRYQENCGEGFGGLRVKNRLPDVSSVPVVLYTPSSLLPDLSVSSHVHQSDKPYDYSDSSLPDYLDRYSGDCGLYGEQSQHALKGVQLPPLQSTDAVEHTPNCCNWDELDTVHTHSHPPQLYAHPYRKDIRRASVELQYGTCDFTPCGKRWVIDLTVSEVSHYCTTTGLVNQNCWDELTHFSSSQFFYMLSRNRSTCGVKPYVRATTNPDADSWVKEFLSCWIDPTFPNPAESGEVRWFIREGGQIIWCDATTPFAKSVTFIRSSIYDNQILLEKNPEYLANLKALPLVERMRLLDGDWSIRPSGNKFKRHWFEIVDALPSRFEQVVRYWDLAATEPKGNNDPDYTAGVKIGRKDGLYYVLDVVQERLTPGKVETLIKNTAPIDGQECVIIMEQEPGSGGVNTIAMYRRLLAGYEFHGNKTTGSKELRANAASSQAEGGNIKLLRAFWNDKFLNELAAFPMERVHDDMVDAFAGSMEHLFLPGPGGGMLMIPLEEDETGQGWF